MRVSLVIALAACSTACSARAPAGPAWPRPAAVEGDGGESLAPRPAARTIAAIVEDHPPDDHAAAGPVAEASAAPAPAGGAQPAAAAAAAPASEEPETLEEEIVIEVED